ncbi:hypothetical protein LTR37_010114 [Vermiconidia calcicola]|uniref:Uncharacterized protein n=1 Tax=Vermiconidia calcicola TaxID=1690605 RepID=A0ACC3N5R7_9PEZI|nr:hypothetical protein LTR37_010114 [Vermiconidia calcicola]
MDPNNPEDKSNQISGFKATLSNPNVSDDAKANAREQLKALGADNFDYASEVPAENNKNPGNVAGGLKAAINNPQVSDEGKDSAKKQLDNM